MHSPDKELYIHTDRVGTKHEKYKSIHFSD